MGKAMRYSIEGHDRGYAAWRGTQRAGLQLTVYLDGKKVTHPLMADTKLGHVLAYDLDANGKVQLTKSRRYAKRIRMYGCVTVETTRAT